MLYEWKRLFVRLFVYIKAPAAVLNGWTAVSPFMHMLSTCERDTILSVL